jgi:hypothetical protein
MLQWRRRESNPRPDARNMVTQQQVTKIIKALSGNCQDSVDVDWFCLSLIDTELAEIILSWERLPTSIRAAVMAVVRSAES